MPIATYQLPNIIKCILSNYYTRVNLICIINTLDVMLKIPNVENLFFKLSNIGSIEPYDPETIFCEIPCMNFCTLKIRYNQIGKCILCLNLLLKNQLNLIENVTETTE